MYFEKSYENVCTIKYHIFGGQTLHSFTGDQWQIIVLYL